MYLYAAVLLALSFLLSQRLPGVYSSVRRGVIENSKQLESESRGGRRSWPGALCCLMPCLIVYAVNGDAATAAMVLLMGIAAYCDMMTRWIPDCLIYGCVWLSLACHTDSVVSLGLLSAALFCLPVMIMQAAAWLKLRTVCFATGDLYLLPAAGLWVKPEYAFSVMAVGLIPALVASRFVKQVPFITCLFPIFVGYLLCESFLP